MPVLIGMRCLQAIGSSAVISVGAGSLADMYEVHERGQKVCSGFKDGAVADLLAWSLLRYAITRSCAWSVDRWSSW
jgi:MFS family permease